MRSFVGAAFANVDGPAVFGDCLPRWENSALCVNFYETASYVVRGRAPIVGAGAVVRKAECGPRSIVRGYAPMMGAAGVVRNAECGPGAEFVGANQSWVHLGLSAMRSLNRSRVVVGALLVE